MQNKEKTPGVPRDARFFVQVQVSENGKLMVNAFWNIGNARISVFFGNMFMCRCDGWGNILGD